MSVRHQLKLLLGGLHTRHAGESAPGGPAPHSASSANAALSATREFLDRNRLDEELLTQALQDSGVYDPDVVMAYVFDAAYKER